MVLVCYDMTVFVRDTTTGIRIWNMRVQINQMKFLAMCIISQKLSFYIFTEENVKHVFMEHDVW